MTAVLRKTQPRPKFGEPNEPFRTPSKIESTKSADKDHWALVKANALDDYVPRPEFAEQLRHKSTRTLEMWAHKGIGPRVTILSKRAWYHKDDIRHWVDAQRAKAESRFAEQEEAQ